MITDKEFADAVHLNLHAIRLLTEYKSSEFERKISKLVIEKFSPTCKECNEIGTRIKLNPPQEKESIFKKIGKAIENT